jgi:hypothetical protein
MDMLKELEETWKKNSMTGGTDRASTVRALVRGEVQWYFRQLSKIPE